MKTPNKPDPIPNVTKRHLQKNETWKGDSPASGSNAGPLIFVTEGHPKGVALREKPTPDEGLVVWAMGHPEERSPSNVLWGRLKWEIQLFFALHNVGKDPLSVYDFHAHVYEVSGREMPLALMIHRARIELCQDNSIFSTDTALHLGPGEVQHVKLVCETSLYDTLMTTVVFGIFADYYIIQHGTAHRSRIPSDMIYVFQHWHQWGEKQCHLVARDEAGVQSRLAEDPKNEDLKKFCGLLLRHYQEHMKLGQTQPNATATPESDGMAGEAPPALLSAIRCGKRQTTCDLPAVEKKSHMAGKLLRMMACLDRQPVPWFLVAEMVYQSTLEGYDTLRRETLAKPDLYMEFVKMKDGTRVRDEALALLCREGFLEVAAQGALRLQPEIGKSVLQAMTVGDQSHWVEYAIRSVDALLPNPDRFVESRYRLLAPHVLSCLSHLNRLAIASMHAVGLSMNVSDCLCKAGLRAEAEPYCRYILVNIGKLPEAAPALIAGVKLTYSEVLRLQGKFDGLEEVLKEAGEALAEVKGKDSVDYAIAVHNLGALYRDTGKTAEAELLFDRAFAVFEKRLGPTSSLLPEIMEDHAKLYTMTNRPAKAKAALERALEFRKACEAAKKCKAVEGEEE